MASQPRPSLKSWLKDWRVVTTFVAGVPLAAAINLFTGGEPLWGLLFIAFTLLMLVIVPRLYGREKATPHRKMLDWLYALSLPTNVVLIVALSHWLSVGWTLTSFGLFTSAFFVGLYSSKK